jgi:hypothetical protein
MAESKDMDRNGVQIGVYVCHCGTNIAGTVDVEALTEYAATLPGVTSPPPFGGNQRTIVINVNPDRLKAYQAELFEYINEERGHEEWILDDIRALGADAHAEVVEGGVRFPVDPLGGQKTGWFYDQRPNRDRVAALADGARVLDVFSHVGAFGLRCAAAGALAVTLVDSSAPALVQAERAAALNGIPVRRYVIGVFVASGVIAGESAGGNDTVDMGVKLEFLVPGMEHAEEADLGSEMGGITSHFE